MSVQIWKRAQGYFRRRAVRRFFRRPCTINTDIPLISFTFDDFPRSALLTGGAVLDRFGIKGTYYAALGLMGKQAPPGEMFLLEDLKKAYEDGHELGCHTFGHCNSAETKPATFEQSIVKNQFALNQLLPGVPFKTFAYPISEPLVRTKMRTARHFECCRGCDQNFNHGAVDLNFLSSFLLEKSRDNPEAVKNLIDRNDAARGWLILATHDVCSKPSPFGCTPSFFEEIVQYAVKSGARILPVTQALEALCS